MVVFLDYSLRPSGKTLENSPELLEKLKQTVSDTTGSPILARAPLRRLREPNTFDAAGKSAGGVFFCRCGHDGRVKPRRRHPPSRNQKGVAWVSPHDASLIRSLGLRQPRPKVGRHRPRADA